MQVGFEAIVMTVLCFLLYFFLDPLQSVHGICSNVVRLLVCEAAAVLLLANKKDKDETNKRA